MKKILSIILVILQLCLLFPAVAETVEPETNTSVTYELRTEESTENPEEEEIGTSDETDDPTDVAEDPTEEPEEPVEEPTEEPEEPVEEPTEDPEADIEEPANESDWEKILSAGIVDSDETIKLNGDLVLPAEQTVVLRSGELVLEKDASLTIEGVLAIEGGRLLVSKGAVLTNHNRILLTKTGSLCVKGKYHQSTDAVFSWDGAEKTTSVEGVDAQWIDRRVSADPDHTIARGEFRTLTVVIGAVDLRSETVDKKQQKVVFSVNGEDAKDTVIRYRLFPSDANEKEIDWIECDVSDAQEIMISESGVLEAETGDKSFGASIEYVFETESKPETPVEPEKHAELTITAPQTSVSIDEELQLSATLTTDETEDVDVAWSCEAGTGEGIIDEDGVFTGLSEGTVTVYAVTQDGSELTQSIEITVNAYTSAPRITTQPVNKTVLPGEVAEFSVVASNATKYQWYYLAPGSETWTAVSASSGKTASYSLTAAARHNGYQYRCEVSNNAGSVTSKAVTLTVLLPVSIVAQPTDQTVNVGETVTFTIEAANATKYEWQYLAPGADTWSVVTAASGKTAQYSFTTAARHNGYKYRCEVSNSLGAVISNEVVLTVITAPTITAQPTDQTVNAGDLVTFTVTAMYAKQYQWYYLATGTDEWKPVTSTGGKLDTYSFSTAARHDGYQYRCVVSNDNESVTSDTVTLTVITAPKFTTQPESQTVNVGETATFTVVVKHATKYQWYYLAPGAEDWAKVSRNGTDATYTFTTAERHDGYQYRCEASNSIGATMSSTVTLTVITAPKFTKQPENKTVNVGETATFTVVAKHATKYQWYYLAPGAEDWVKVTTNGRAATYTVNTEARHDGFQYRCEASNNIGATMSSTVTLTVITAPKFTKQPENKTVNVGETATFTVVAKHATQYQWYYLAPGAEDWAKVSQNGTAATYTFTTAARHDGYQYRCEASNSIGATMSSTVTLTVITAPKFTKQPEDQTVVVGNTVTFTVVATQTTQYQWYYLKPGAEDWVKVTTNGRAATYTVNTKARHNGYKYRCEASNGVGTTMSSTATLTVITMPEITQQPSDQTVAIGKIATFKVASPNAESYQWYYKAPGTDEWKPVTSSAGKTDIYSFKAEARHDGYIYRCKITNAVGSIDSDEATLTVIPKPTITKQPASISVYAGQTASFTVEATNAKTYQWWYLAPGVEEWVKVTTNGRAATYTFTTAERHNGYKYRCEITNDSGKVTSNTATLTVIPKPTITKQPSDCTVYFVGTAMFSVTATNATQYQWQFQKPGETSWTDLTSDSSREATYSFTARWQNGYKFRCIVSNPAGSVTSQAVTLTIVPAPVITRHPADLTVIAGQVAEFRVEATDAVTYQWYYLAPGAGEWTKVTTNGRSDTYSFTTAARHNGYRYRCEVKNPAGTVTSNEALLTVVSEPTISTHPQSQTVYAGEKVTFIVVSGNAESYQWWYLAPGAEEWRKVTTNGRAATYTLVTEARHNGYKYCCDVTNLAGTKTSNVATLTVIPKPTITAQPVNQSVYLGEQVIFRVEATNAESYQWQFYDPKEDNPAWIDIPSATNAQYSFVMDNDYDVNRCRFRCIVSNGAGSVTSSAATLTVIPKPTITTEPTNQSVYAGDTVTFSIVAKNATSYQWYYLAAGSSEWKAVSSSAGKQATYSFTAEERHNGYKYYCVAANPSGNTKSGEVTLTILYIAPEIIEQPEDQYVSPGEYAVFCIYAINAESYQWQYRTSASGSWTNVSSASGKTDTYSFEVASRHNGYQYRCIVKNGTASVTSDVATLTVYEPWPSITTQPTNQTVYAGDTVTFRVVAVNATRYQWYYKSSGSSSWTPATSSSGKTATYSFSAQSYQNGYQFYCEVSNASGDSVNSNIVTLTVNEVNDPYNLGDETYSFENYTDSDSEYGHCFGMSMTSSFYYLGLLDISVIGGNAYTPLYSFSNTSTVRRPICHYQAIQGSAAVNSVVAGGNYWVYDYIDTVSDWNSVVNYVKNHNYDQTGKIIVSIFADNGGHAVNFLRYEKVNGQDRIYVYDNNFPTVECYFYLDSSGRVQETPRSTFDTAVFSIAIHDCATYYSLAEEFDSTHALYAPKGAVTVPGYDYYVMIGYINGKEYVMYEIPSDVEQITIIPNNDNASFIYMNKEYSFEKISSGAQGELRFATVNKLGILTDAEFRIVKPNSEIK